MINKKLFRLMITISLLSAMCFYGSAIKGQDQVRRSATSNAEGRCRASSGVWDSGKCYIPFNSRVVIKNYLNNTTKPYPMNAKSCGSNDGLWRDGKCYLPMINRADLKGKGEMSLFMTCEELDKARNACIAGGGLFWERDNDGFCYETLKSDTNTMRPIN